MADRIGTIALLSLEPWDEVWRRNQHLASRLVASGVVREIVFVTPPKGGLAFRSSRAHPLTGVEVVTPPLVVPRRYGGYRVLAWWLRRTLRDVDIVWVNDPVAGLAVSRQGKPVVYDVTDDWRSMPQSEFDRAATVTAEDSLAIHATTVVCSAVLRDRWRERYGVEATLIPNGVDMVALGSAACRALDGAGPHAVYVGTLHANRFDVDLVVELARSWAGTVHLVGPDHLDSAPRTALSHAGVRVHGPVPSRDVPSWLVSADVLICPHVVDDFTLSLDAIKDHEYLATTRPVVATASSGFQSITAPGLVVAARDEFVAAVATARGTGPFARPAPPSWAHRAADFAAVLAGAR